MQNFDMIVILLVVLALVFAGVHIAIALGITAVLGIYLMLGDIEVVRTFVANTAYEALRDYVFAVIPLFMLMGDFLAKGGAATELYTLAHRMSRWLTFLDPSRDATGAGYHINQALIAVGSGGLLGVGLGKSIQVYGYLPEASNDSIFAIIADEKEEGKPRLHLFTTFDLDLDEANQILQRAGFSNLVKISSVQKIDEIPLMGAGKTDYRKLQDLC